MHGEVGDRQSGTTGSGGSLSGNTNGGLDQFRLVQKSLLNLERKVNYTAFFFKLAFWQDYYF